MSNIYGTNYSESLYGTPYADNIYGYGGHDLLSGSGGNDFLFGGAGDDDLIGGTGYNDYWGGSGYDWFIMSPRSSAGFSDDLVYDFTFNVDKVDVSAWGVSDFSQIKALLERDATGSATLNAYYAGYVHQLTLDRVNPASLISSDFIYSNSGAKNLTGTVYGDVLFGSRYGDVLSGSYGHDILLGGLGNDTLNGGSGDDEIIGGAGKDTQIGGSGYDCFVFASAAETQPGANRDLIKDFRLDFDLIDFEDIDARPDLSGDQDFMWGGFGAFTAPGQVCYAYSGSNTVISGNTDFDSTAEFQVELTGRYTLIAGDFDL